MQNIALKELNAFLIAQRKLDKKNRKKTKTKTNVRSFTLIPKSKQQQKVWEQHINLEKTKSNVKNKKKPEIIFY